MMGRFVGLGEAIGICAAGSGFGSELRSIGLGCGVGGLMPVVFRHFPITYKGFEMVF